jgi:hypothetical protein
LSHPIQDFFIALVSKKSRQTFSPFHFSLFHFLFWNDRRIKPLLNHTNNWKEAEAVRIGGGLAKVQVCPTLNFGDNRTVFKSILDSTFLRKSLANGYWFRVKIELAICFLLSDSPKLVY